MTDLPLLKLRPGAGRRLASGHLWVFSNELEAADTSIPPGSIVRLAGPGGEPAGTGFYNHASLIAVRLLARGAEPLAPDFLERRLAAALAWRKELGVENACRLVFGESDGLPGLVIDRYGPYLAAEILSAGTERLKDRLVSALKNLVSPAGLIFRNSHAMRKLEGLQLYTETVGEVPDETVIEENGLKLTVPLARGQKTGYYFDQRENRARLAPWFKGRKVLDLYAYTGSFALLAAKSGAASVWGVDSSAAAVELAKRNAEANGLGGRALFHEQDAEEVIEAFSRGSLPEKPDFVLFDPPNLVRNRKNLPQARKLYVKLHRQLLAGLPQGGLLATSSCSHHVSREIFLGIIEEAAARAGRRCALLEYATQAKDHPVLVNMPETQYLHFALLRAL